MTCECVGGVLDGFALELQDAVTAGHIVIVGFDGATDAPTRKSEYVLHEDGKLHFSKYIPTS
jgi:hypothetical protein